MMFHGAHDGFPVLRGLDAIHGVCEHVPLKCINEC